MNGKKYHNRYLPQNMRQQSRKYRMHRLEAENEFKPGDSIARAKNESQA